MEKKGWKNLAIIFIILFVIETIFLSWAYSAGVSSLDKENICAYNICGDDPKIVYYDYFEYEELCECYDEDMKLVSQEYLG